MRFIWLKVLEAGDSSSTVWFCEGFTEGGVMVEVCAKEVQVSWEEGKPEKEREAGRKVFLL